MSQGYETKPGVYLTDDRNARNRSELLIECGENGDYYIATVPEGHRWPQNSVRICTSGGCASSNTRLMLAIAEAYRSLQVPRDMTWMPESSHQHREIQELNDRIRQLEQELTLANERLAHSFAE